MSRKGLGIYQVTQKNGERCSAARAYIHPHMGNRPNLRVETLAHATRILFEGKRAVGVEYRQGKELKQFAPRREVIVSSGAFQSPQLLMLSGVGDSAVLGKHGIAPCIICPASGRTCRITRTSCSAHVRQPYFTAFRSKRDAAAAAGHRPVSPRTTGPMTSNFAESGGFLKTRPDLDIPDIQLHFGMALADDHGRKRHRGTASRATSACCGRRAAAASGSAAPTRRARR